LRSQSLDLSERQRRHDERYRQSLKEKRQQVVEQRIAANVPAKYRRHSFDSLRSTHSLSDSQRDAIDMTEDYTKCGFVDLDIEIMRNVLYVGGVGVGKTHLAMMSLGHLLQSQRGYSIEWQQLASEVRATYSGNGSSSDVIWKYRDCPILLLDDFGVDEAGTRTADRVRIAEEVLFPRFLNENQVTIMTSNLNVDQMIGSFSQRLAGRINENFAVIEISGRDLRM